MSFRPTRKAIADCHAHSGAVRETARKARLLASAVIPAAMMLAAGPAQAGTYEWTGGTGNFADGANWSPSGVPLPGDSAEVKNGGTAILQGAAALRELLLGGYSLSGHFKIDASATLTVSE